MSKNRKFIVVYVLLIQFIVVGCSNIDNITNANIVNGENTVSYEGKIIEMEDNNNFVIRVNNGTDLISLNINEEIEFSDGVSNKFNYGNTIGIVSGTEVMESWPLQVNLLKIYKNEKAVYMKINQYVAKKLIDTQDVLIIDVRTQEEYEEGYIQGAILLTLDTIDTKADEILKDKNKTILVYCRSGNRSKEASQKLIEMGYTNIYDFGGINTWEYNIVID
ncbi:rhodanese-like domain-containing protein [Clostridium sp. DL1XJH146]